VGGQEADTIRGTASTEVPLPLWFEAQPSPGERRNAPLMSQHASRESERRDSMPVSAIELSGGSRRVTSTSDKRLTRDHYAAAATPARIRRDRCGGAEVAFDKTCTVVVGMARKVAGERAEASRSCRPNGPLEGDVASVAVVEAMESADEVGVVVSTSTDERAPDLQGKLDMEVTKEGVPIRLVEAGRKQAKLRRATKSTTEPAL
jgi:hypothetical protein